MSEKNDFWNSFDHVEVIHVYPLEQGIEDGIIVPIFEHRWAQLTGGKPLVVTAAIRAEFSDAAIQEIWNEYVFWRRHVMATLPEEEQMFVTEMNGRKVWVLEDGAFTILFPEDY